MAGLIDLAGFVSPLLEKLANYIPDPVAKAKALADAQTELLTFATQQTIAQTEINKVEAASTSLFIAGWRPFVGWVGGVALAWVYVGSPVIYVVTGHGSPPPLDHLWELLAGLLGLGGMRSYDKKQGTAT